MSNKQSDWFNQSGAHRKMKVVDGVVSEDNTTSTYKKSDSKPVSSAAAPMIHSNGDRKIVDGVVTSLAKPQWGMTI